MRIGVLALQGDFAEHLAALRRLGVEAIEVRLPQALDELAGLIIPGGESTTIGKLATQYGLLEPLKRFGAARPIWGTCAGAIFLSQDAQRDQPLLGLMATTVERNAFGRQAASFEIDLSVPALREPKRPFRAVFIRAPVIATAGEGVEILAQLPEDQGTKTRIVAARQGHLLATCFHPELSEDDRFHAFFLQIVAGVQP
jgi:5'-phosphate synthase pdxT subunit